MKASLEYPTVMGRPLMLPASTCNKQWHSGTGGGWRGECGWRRAKFTFRQTNTKPDCGRQRAPSKELPVGRSKKCREEGGGEGRGGGGIARIRWNQFRVGGGGNYERRLQQLQFYATFWLNFCANSCLNIRQTRKG